MARNTLNSLDEILLEGTHEGLLLLGGLESTVTELGGGVDPLEVDLLGGTAGGLGVEGLAESHDTLLDTGNGALDHDEVVLDLTVVNEATKTVKMLVKCFLTRQHRRTYGVICFLEISNSVEALPASVPLPMRKTLWLQEVRWW